MGSQSVTGNALYLFLGTALYRGSALICLPLMTRGLGPAEYGRFELIYAAALLLVPLTGAQSSESSIAMYRRGEKRAISTAALLEFCGILLLTGVVGFAHHLGAISTSAGLSLVGLTAATVIWQQVRCTLRALNEYTALLWAEAVQSIVLICAVVAAVAAGANAPIVVGAFALGSLVASTAAVLRPTSLRESVSRPPDLAVMLGMLRIGVPMLLTVVMWWLIEFSDRLILNWYLGSEAVAIFSGAARLSGLLLAGMLIVYQAWQVHALDSLGSRGRQAFFARSLYYWQAMTLTAASVLLAAAPLLVTWVLGSDFHDSLGVMLVLVPAQALVCFSYFLGIVYLSEETARRAVLPSICAAGLNVALNLTLIPQFGVTGAAWSSLCAFALMTTWRWLFAAPRMKMERPPYRATIGLGIVCLQAATYAQTGWALVNLLGLILTAALFRDALRAAPRNIWAVLGNARRDNRA